MTRPGSGSIVTPVGFSVYQTSVTDCPGLIEAGWTVKSTILAGISLAFPYADPSNPADTAPGARGAVCPEAGCDGACAQIIATVKVDISANVSIGFISDPFYDLIIRPSANFM
jgi:hypothetical protein